MGNADKQKDIHKPEEADDEEIQVFDACSDEEEPKDIKDDYFNDDINNGENGTKDTNDAKSKREDKQEENVFIQKIKNLKKVLMTLFPILLLAITAALGLGFDSGCCCCCDNAQTTVIHKIIITIQLGLTVVAATIDLIAYFQDAKIISNKNMDNKLYKEIDAYKAIYKRIKKCIIAVSVLTAILTCSIALYAWL